MTGAYASVPVTEPTAYTDTTGQPEPPGFSMQPQTKPKAETPLFQEQSCPPLATMIHMVPLTASIIAVPVQRSIWILALQLPDSASNYKMEICTGDVAYISVNGKTYKGGEFVLNENAVNNVCFDSVKGSLLVTQAVTESYI